ncbi:MAG: hypothetical protein ACE5Q3_12300 [Alphaproteobacteria bacterium]
METLLILLTALMVLIALLLLFLLFATVGTKSHLRQIRDELEHQSETLEWMQRIIGSSAGIERLVADPPAGTEPRLVRQAGGGSQGRREPRL